VKAPIRELSTADFDQSLTDQSGIVLFFKTLCPFCKTLEAVFDKFAPANPEVALFRVDFEKNGPLSARFQIERAPTLLIFKNGQVVGRKTGLMNPKELGVFYRQASLDPDRKPL
jgi:thioredoxin 1